MIKTGDFGNMDKQYYGTRFEDVLFEVLRNTSTALLRTGIYFYGHSVCNSSLVQLFLVLDRGDNTLAKDIHRVRKRLYHFLIFFLGAQCVESGVSCTDCY